MTPAFTVEQRAFRSAVRTLLAEPDIRRIAEQHAALPPGEEVDMRPVHRRLGERGWLATAWPATYGGNGRTAVEAAILHQEIVRSGLPDLSYVVSICYVGDFLLMAGTDHLKSTYLPRLARGEATACTLYSETEAGSDLGSLASRAELVDGGFLLHGAKVHSQATQHADYAMIAARTGDRGEAKHDGITLFWVPLHTPGIRIEPVAGMNDHPFSRVVLDGAFVPTDHVVGRPGQGWSTLNEALTLERTGFEAYLKMRSWLDALRDNVINLGDPVTADRFTALDTAVAAGGTVAWAMVGKQARREIDYVGSAMSKWYITELARPIARLALDVAGADGLAAGHWADRCHREAPGMTLSAGTSEIMLHSISSGHLRVRAENGEPSALDDPHAAFRRRIGRFLAGLHRDRRPGEVTDGWPALVRSNIVRLTLPRADGGLGGGLTESLVAAEEMGKVLLRSPFAATVSTAEALTPGSPLWSRVAAVVAGEHTIGMGTDEAALTADGRLTGSARHVPFGDQVDSVLVHAGDRLVMVDCDQNGVTANSHTSLSHGRLVSLEFKDVVVPAANVLCAVDSAEGRALIARIRLRHAAHLLGLSQRAFDLTLAYTRKRKQFDTAIAAFQHTSFQLASLATRLHVARQALHAPTAIQAGPLLAMVVELARETTATALQLHGARGLSDAADIQLYYRHAAMETVLLGSPVRLRATAVPPTGEPLGEEEHPPPAGDGRRLGRDDAGG